MRSIVLGTAGHIDHGKTALVRALTGVDTDRLPEEKARGMTIELGFAPLVLPSGVRVGIVDVPGHERFVRAMVAGAGGIDLALLVVAASEGVMPQTREHLAICRLLGIRGGVVALTKVDLVDDDMLELARDDVRTLVAGSFLEGAALVPVSAHRGTGLGELLAAIDRAAAAVPGRDAAGPVRLPVDRAFTVKGFGVVVTGTLVSGRLEVGQNVELLPAGRRAKVRGLQVHGASQDHVEAGTRLAANLAGVEAADVERWQWLTKEGELETTRELDARVELLSGCKRALPRRARVVVHVGTATRIASLVVLDGERIEPGGLALCRLRLDAPLIVLPEDRLILRADVALAPHGGTIGGGIVLRPFGGAYRRRADAALRARTVESATASGKVAAETLWSGPIGLTALDVRRRVYPESAPALGQARKEGVIVEVEPGRFVHRETVQALEERAQKVVTAHHQSRPLEPGIGREELRTRLMGGVGAGLYQRVLSGLSSRGRLVVSGDTVRLPGHKPGEEGRGNELSARLGTTLAGAGLGPPRLKELAAAMGASERDTTLGLKLLGTAGRAVRVSDELYFDATAIAALRARLTSFLEERGSISAQEWKELTGVSRKFSIPLAEHFDAEKLTMRVGETRVLRRRG